MSVPRLLAVSPPSHVPLNRAVYHDLADRHGIEVHLAAPRRLFIAGRWHDTPPTPPTACGVTLLDLVGHHGRLQFLRGLGRLIAQRRPTHILVDSDPASVLVWQAVHAAPGCAVWALTAENLRPDYGRDFASGLRSLRPGRAMGPLLTMVLRRRVHPRVDRVFTLSRDGTHVMEALGFAGRVTQIPLGFDPSLFRIQDPEHIARTRARLRLTQPTVAYFGRVTPEKGVHLLVRALASLKDLPWQLLIDNFATYDTGYVSQLGALIRETGIADRVVHFDARHEQMPDYMNAADIVVLPSLSTPKWREQYGRVLPEAMACGKLVVGSDSGAIPELLAGHGKLFPEGNVGALTERLAALLRMGAGERAAEGVKACKYAHERLSITRQADIWADQLKRG